MFSSMNMTLLLAWDSSPGTTSSGISSALPMTSVSQEVGSGLAGLSPFHAKPPILLLWEMD